MMQKIGDIWIGESPWTTQHEVYVLSCQIQYDQVHE